MILVHLMIGMLSGTIAAAVLWQFGYPLWLMIISYSLVGALGLLGSAFARLTLSWLAEGIRRREARKSHRELASDKAWIPPPQFP